MFFVKNKNFSRLFFLFLIGMFSGNYTMQDEIIFPTNSKLVTEYKGFVVIDSEDPFGDTPLHHAVERQDIDEVTKLLKIGANCCIPNTFEETPLSLALHKDNENLLDCFERYGGCYFVRHDDFALIHTDLKSLLTDNAKKFYTVVSQGLHVEGVASMMSTLHRMFDRLEKNQTLTDKEGVLMSFSNLDCLLNMKTRDLERFFGESCVSDIKDFVMSYKAANELVLQANSCSYCDVLCKIFKQYPRLSNDLLFNHYIMTKLMNNVRKEYWLLLFMKKFNPNAQLASDSFSIMHVAALAHNKSALSSLAFNGAHCLAKNAEGKTPIDIIIEKAPSDIVAISCLSAIKESLNAKILFLREKEQKQNIEELLKTQEMIEQILQDYSVL
jgi:hypothetical protein